MKNSVKNGLIFGAGFFACVLFTFLVPLLVMAMGLMDMSASAKPGLLEKIFYASGHVLRPEAGRGNGCSFLIWCNLY